MLIFYENYLEYYEKRVRNVLKEIDLHIACEESINIESLSEMLCIPISEIRSFSNQNNLKSFEIISVLGNSSSYLSKMLKRELETKADGLYTKEQISYIYNIDKGILSSIFEELSINKASGEDLPKIFKRVKLS